MQLFLVFANPNPRLPNRFHSRNSITINRIITVTAPRKDKKIRVILKRSKILTKVSQWLSMRTIFQILVIVITFHSEFSDFLQYPQASLNIFKI